MSILVQRASDVRFNEIDLSQIVTGASSSVAGQVIVSTQGSTKMRRFTSGQDYLNEYGNPNAKVSFDVYCGLDYFREGDDLWGLRVVGEGARYAGLVMYNDGTSTKLGPVSAGVEDPEYPAWSSIVPAGTTPIALFYPNKGPGSYAKYEISIESPNLVTVPALTVATSSSGGSLTSGTYQYQISAIAADGGETAASNPINVIISGSGVTNSAILTWTPVPSAIGYRIYGRTSAGIGLMAEVGQASANLVDTGEIIPDTSVRPGTGTQSTETTFIVNVFDPELSIDTPVESFECSLVDGVDDNGVATEIEERINPFSQFIQVKSNVPSLGDVPTVTDASQAAMDGGDSGAAPTAFDVALAWASFSNRNVYGTNLFINSGHSTPNVQMAMEEVARGRGDAVALLDVPSNRQQWQQAIDYRQLTLKMQSSYAALFCPDVLESDNINGKQQYVPFSGWAAALCARTDRVANPSFSIAGLNRGLVNVLGTRHQYDDAQASALFKAQVNYTRTFVNQGIALWEQKTLQNKDTALSWLSVRRIVNTIKVALYDFGLYILQEPNDDFTGQTLVTSFNDYLEAVKNARGLHSYSVVSNNTNNTEAMRISGIRKVTVVLVPTIPLHELQVDIVISKSGVSFEETLRQLYGG